MHQWEWAVAAGLDRITWTFDPLVRRNGRFNLHRLGARIVRYVPDFYGALDDGVNGTWPTDRCVVAWPTDRPLGSRVGVEPALPVLVADGADRDDDEPVVHLPDGALTESAGASSIATPRDIVTLRLRRPEVAARWSQAMKVAMTAVLDAGHVGVDVSTDGTYRFERPDDRQAATSPLGAGRGG